MEERASLSPDALTGMEASLRFVGPETLETKIFGRLSAWQNWIFTRPNSTGEHGALTLYGRPERPQFQWKRTYAMTSVISDEKIPNNVDLSSDRRLQRALEAWQPKFIDWWKEMGPVGWQARDIYLRTAISRRDRRLGALRLRQDARLSLGDLPRAEAGASRARLR